MASVNMHFLHLDKSLLLLTVTLRGVSKKHCLLSLFSFSLHINGIFKVSLENLSVKEYMFLC